MTFRGTPLVHLTGFQNLSGVFVVNVNRTYVNEALWPSQKAADAFAHDWMGDVPDEVKEFRSELDRGVEAVLTVRYVDESG